ncbi:EXOSC10 family protein [Megaselia abdita]
MSSEVIEGSKNEKKSTPIGKFPSVNDFVKNGLAEIMVTTKAVNAFPSGSARDFYSTFPTFEQVIETQKDRILGIISHVLKKENIKGNIQRRQPDEQFEMILECNDLMLERINTNLDEISGIRKNPETILIESKIASNSLVDKAGSWNINKNGSQPSTSSPYSSARLLTAKNIPRPQFSFKVPVDNSRLTPFVPRIKDKPNSLKPLAILPEYDEDGTVVSYIHPYEFELLKFEPSEEFLKKTSPEFPKKLEEVGFELVSKASKLPEILKELKEHKMLAIDVEHHSYRTFQGITCLLQVSTPVKDYIFDTIELREDLHVLNEVFTDTKILKIFHGADMDIEWLQRDLSLYIVNMFDTHQAAKLLNLSRLSLSFLLKHYCNVEADKTFQLADWRIRPLPEELIKYARQDTHYLIYMYKMITNDLLEQGNNKPNLLKAVFQQSTEVCKKRYIKPVIRDESHLDIFRKSKRVFDNRQLFALKEIFHWRDILARQEDESCGYILPNHMMLQIAESLPREMQGILACCNPIPPLVRQSLHSIHQIILKAREQPLVKPIVQEQIVHRTSTRSNEYSNKLYCPHDLTHCSEFRDDLPTLFNGKEETVTKTSFKLPKPALSVFETPENSEDEEHVKEKLDKLSKVIFVSPYERYQAMIPLIEKEKLEEAKRLETENSFKLLCPIKPEPGTDDTLTKPESAEDDPYKLPMKQQLKRKRGQDEEIPQANGESSDQQDSKKFKDGEPVLQNIRPKKKGFRNKPNKKPNQNSNEPIANFDYKNANLNMFKGGSKKVQGTQLKNGRFQARSYGNKATNKKFNKLLNTVSNASNKKK